MSVLISRYNLAISKKTPHRRHKKKIVDGDECKGVRVKTEILYHHLALFIYWINLSICPNFRIIDRYNLW